MKKLIREILMGHTSFSEYVRISAPDDIPEKIYLEAGGQISEVSKAHFLLCVEPIVFGVWLEKEQVTNNNSYRLYFGNAQKPEAVVNLELFNTITEACGRLLLLKLRDSHIHHLSFIKNYLIWYRYYTRNGMTFSKFKSHVCAYSYPRRIRIISYRQDNYYNIFPMDLLGEIPQHKKYVFGLRHSNVTLSRIIETRKLLVAEAPYTQQENIFQLGKHHSTSAPPVEALPFTICTSKNFGFFVPSWADSYKEIQIVRNLNLGSHMLLWGQVRDETVLQQPKDHLHMVHFLHFLHQKNKGNFYHRL